MLLMLGLESRGTTGYGERRQPVVDFRRLDATEDAFGLFFFFLFFLLEAVGADGDGVGTVAVSFATASALLLADPESRPVRRTSVLPRELPPPLVNPMFLSALPGVSSSCVETSVSSTVVS